MKAEVETKYNIGDEGFVLHDNKIVKIKITFIYIECKTKSTESRNSFIYDISYQTNSNILGFRTFNEKQIFKTTDDIFKELTKDL